MNTLSTKPRTELPSLLPTQENKKEQRTLKTIDLLPPNFDSILGLTFRKPQKLPRTTKDFFKMKIKRNKMSKIPLKRFLF